MKDSEGYSYEREAIVNWLKRNSTSPVTRNPLSAENLVPNRALRDAIKFRKQKEERNHYNPNMNNLREEFEIEKVNLIF